MSHLSITTYIRCVCGVDLRAAACDLCTPEAYLAGETPTAADAQCASWGHLWHDTGWCARCRRTRPAPEET